MSSNNRNRHILITGASSGIGLAISRALLDDGYRVLGVSRSIDKVSVDHEGFQAYALDFSDIDALSEKLAALAKSYPDIDAIIFCAGQGLFGSIEEFSFEQIRSLMDVNFLSQAYLAKTYLPLFKKRNKGDLIFIGSESALKGSRQGSIYCASKFAVRGMVQALREECSRNNIRVAIVNPGMVKGSFFEKLDFEPGDDPENFLVPEDVAQAVKYILDSRELINLDEISLSPMKRVVQKKKK